ncbi:hypothetical protein CERSUDRAFT_97551 [Gelatoporia subvermispora B]|uniref:Uncharacterized protein n=1 Tax=Ceriporiopsis subvermispora (strain B) TaxID=914234 RepID=M2QBC0_CERS8|nr:hypothetical protein CERSUDRAFT_97551 [Gelatoporia subvermispora B]
MPNEHSSAREVQLQKAARRMQIGGPHCEDGKPRGTQGQKHATAERGHRYVRGHAARRVPARLAARLVPPEFVGADWELRCRWEAPAARREVVWQQREDSGGAEGAWAGPGRVRTGLVRCPEKRGAEGRLEGAESESV